MDQTDSIAATALANLSLSAAPKSLSFFGNPFWSLSYDPNVAADLPPFLFRVFHPKSFAQLDGDWVRSRDAFSCNTWESSQRGLSARNEAEAASALNRHLWWIDTEPGHSNLVSWTTSLLVALKLAFYHYHRGTPLECIKLCIVNTKLFPEGIFLRDLCLIKKYKDCLPTSARYFSSNGHVQPLTSLLKLRREGYYFGEFLSQGELHIDGKSCVVSVADLSNRGLLLLLPELGTYDQELKWANWVKHEREKWSNSPRSSPLPAELVDLIDLFKPEFRLHAAAALLSLQPRDPRDPQLMWFMVCVAAQHPDDATLKHCFYAAHRVNPFCDGNPHPHADDLEMREVDQYSTILTNLAILQEKKKELLRSTTPAKALSQSGAQVEAESTGDSNAVWHQTWLRATMKASLCGKMLYSY